ncbi:MAG: ATP-binding protein [Spirulinaceae cyanobacterium]
MSNHSLNPHAPLRHWQIITPIGTDPLFLRPLALDETIFHYLLGQPCLDPQLQGLVKPLTLKQTTLPPSHQALATRLITAWSSPNPPVVQLVGSDFAAKATIAAISTQQLGFSLLTIPAHLLPQETTALQEFCQRLERQTILGRSLVFLDCRQILESDGLAEKFFSQLIEQLPTPFLINSPKPKQISQPCLILEVNPPTKGEQLQLWQTALGDVATNLETELASLAYQYNLDLPTIQTICTQTLTELNLSNSPRELLPSLRQNCHRLVRPALQGLAQHIETKADWEDLILPEKEKNILEEIVAQVTYRKTVSADWGWAGKGQRGQAMVAVFAGASGTGKTMAAELIGKRTGLDVYRIDLAAVVSKYIGETEKHLGQIFDGAERGGAILLFDEGDALFGKRTEVKDSRDRYANLSVSYLLQRLEAYGGLAIITTNWEESLDKAFKRRFRHIVQFPMPDKETRKLLWQRIFPQATPTHQLNFTELAKMHISGGHIRSIALNACFLAVKIGQPVTMKQVAIAARGEYIKLDLGNMDSFTQRWLKEAELS